MKTPEARKILEKISKEGTECTVLKSISYGPIEAWNLCTCYLQNAEIDKSDLVSYVECALCYESDEVQSYFTKLGFTF